MSRLRQLSLANDHTTIDIDSALAAVLPRLEELKLPPTCKGKRLSAVLDRLNNDKLKRLTLYDPTPLLIAKSRFAGLIHLTLVRHGWNYGLKMSELKQIVDKFPTLLHFDCGIYSVVS